jgi:hypothetical protein
MGSKKRQQTINKRNRERAVAEKRALKLQRKQEKREAARNGEPTPLEPSPLEPAPVEPPAEDLAG